MVKRLLMLSHIGPLTPAEYLYNYLSKKGIEVYTVGRLYGTEIPQFQHHIFRNGMNQLTLLWDGRYNETGKRVRYNLDLSVVAELIGTNFDAILEVETENMRITDRNNVLNCPYWYYKTELFSDYVPPFATSFFYAAEKIKKKYLDKTGKYAKYLPFTFDAKVWNEIASKSELSPKSKLFFAGSTYNSFSDPIFKEMYEERTEVLKFLREQFTEQDFTWLNNSMEYPEYLYRLNESKIALNIGVGCLNYRDIEAFALKKPLLTMDHDEYERNGFKNGVHYLGFNSKEDALRKAQILLHDSDYCRQLGKNGFEMLVKNNSPEKRADEVIKAIF